jgi:mevalonate kinase
MDGAMAFAVPTTLGQSLRLTESNGSEIIWKSYDPSGKLWFNASFDLMDFKATKTSDAAISDTLSTILRAASKQNSDFLSHWKKYKVDTYLEFDQNWGLGSSSTLISCIAQWADVSAFHLLFDTLGGSGFDVACAQADGPILYRLGETELDIDYVDFETSFLPQLYLIYLGNKQSTSEGRQKYYESRRSMNGAVDHISQLSLAAVECTSLEAFEKIIISHEEIVAKCLNLPKVKDLHFSDYWGAVKSLGAWGGDFVLATSKASEAETRSYFTNKGYETILKLQEVMKSEVPADTDA